MTQERQKKLSDQTLWLLGAIMMVNALSYGTIIPLLYPYATQFGLNPLGLSILFGCFSLAQFLATPVIGKLSDKYGRRPLLLLSILGTSVSLALFATAQTIVQLFVARILDGITGGNISVAQAVIADKVEGPERAKAFGFLGAAFGFGFLLGPAIGGVLSVYGQTVPFWFASAIALLASIAGYFILPESLSEEDRVDHPSYRIRLFSDMWQAIKNEHVGRLIILGLITTIAIHTYFIGFQTYTVDVLQLEALDLGILFSLSGLLGILVQVFGVKWMSSIIPDKLQLIQTLCICAIVLVALSPLAHTVVLFGMVMGAFMVAQGPIAPFIGGLISEKSSASEQGHMLGMNQSFTSLGQIIGPLCAGVMSTYTVSGIFILVAVFYLISAVYTKWVRASFVK